MNTFEHRHYCSLVGHHGGSAERNFKQTRPGTKTEKTENTTPRDSRTMSLLTAPSRDALVSDASMHYAEVDNETNGFNDKTAMKKSSEFTLNLNCVFSAGIHVLVWVLRMKKQETGTSVSRVAGLYTSVIQSISEQS